MKNFIFAASLAVMLGQAAMAQTSQPTKRAPVGRIDSSWSRGLSDHDTRLVKQVVQGKSDEDRRMIRTAIVRNREASRDIYAGETLTDDKVLANVRVRMTTDESKRGTNQVPPKQSGQAFADLGFKRRLSNETLAASRDASIDPGEVLSLEC